MSTLQGDKGSDTCLYYKVKKVRNEEARNEEGRGKRHEEGRNEYYKVVGVVTLVYTTR